MRLRPAAGGTQVEIVQRGPPEDQAAGFARGWPHFIERLAVAAACGDPGPDPWAP